jgi:hypothetical protein
MKDVGIFHGRAVYFMAVRSISRHFGIFVAICYIL